MIRAGAKQPQISEAEPTVNQFIGLNTFGPHADLAPSELRTLSNMDVFGPSTTYSGGNLSEGYIKTRRGSQVLIDQVSQDLDILNHIVFDAGDKEYVVFQQLTFTGSDFKFIELSASGTFTQVLEKSNAAPFTVPTTNKVDITISNQKIYVFSTTGNSIIEYDTATSKFLRRKMGLPAPQISEVTSAAAGTPGEGIDGKRVYGVELVYKNTDVTPNVDIVVSGPNRAVLTSNPSFKEGRLAYAEGTDLEYTVKVSGTLNDGTSFTDIENGNWTHARLYRTKDLTTATNSTPDLQGGAEIIGREDELYQVQEIDKATFLATESGGFYFFDTDAVKDDDIPFPLDVVTGNRLDMNVIPAADVGTFHRNKIWVSGVVSVPGPDGEYELDSIESKIFYTPESNTQYSESMRALDAIESEPGDGEKMIKLISFQEDLLGIKEGKTGRVPFGDPNSGWVTEDHVIGIEDRDYAQFVPNVGICAIVNDQQDFRIFGYDLAWHSDFAGMQVSRPIRDIIATFTPKDIDFFYMNGKLFLSGGKAQMLVLAVEQRKGWCVYNYPFNGLSESVFTFDEGRRAAVLSRGQRVIEIEVDDLDTDYDVPTATQLPIDYSFTTHRFQDNGGRSLIEQRWLSLVAILETNISCQPFINGKLWDVPFNMLLDPQEYPDAALRETEYQGYSEVKPLGNYIHYVISGKSPATIYSIMLNCLIQRGQLQAGFDPFEVLESAIIEPPWARTDLFIKDASDVDRIIGDFTQNDAGDDTRVLANYTQDDAGNEDRS